MSERGDRSEYVNLSTPQIDQDTPTEASTAKGGLALSARRLRTLVLIALTMPIVLLIRLLRPLALVRVGGLKAVRIGTFAASTEIYLCRRDNDLKGQRILDLFYLPANVCNSQLAVMWRRALRISPLIRYVSRANRVVPGHKIHTVAFPTDRDTEGLLMKTQSHLEFTKEEIEAGLTDMSAMGVPPEREIVCFHARDNAYLDLMIPGQAWRYHDYRDSDAQTYVPAMRELVERGYYTLRMGAVVEQPLVSDDEGVIDYATKWRSDFLDIFLSAQCSFFVGCGAGIDMVSKIFRRPWARVNLIPLEGITGTDRDVFIPKTLWLRKERRLLTFRETIETGLGRAGRSQDYESADVKILNDTPDEITALVLDNERKDEGHMERDR